MMDEESIGRLAGENMALAEENRTLTAEVKRLRALNEGYLKQLKAENTERRSCLFALQGIWNIVRGQDLATQAMLLDVLTVFRDCVSEERREKWSAE